MKKFAKITWMLLLGGALFGCNDAGFKEQTDQAAPAKEPAEATEVVQTGASKTIPGTEDELNPDEIAINRCVEKFESHPFDVPTLRAPRKISASVTVGGIGNPIVDDVPTPEPRLVLISAAVNVLGRAVYKLHNPNGWYCLKVDVNVGGDTCIELADGAHLADSKVDVNVGSSTNQAVGRVGVHVGSNVSVLGPGQCQ